MMRRSFDRCRSCKRRFDERLVIVNSRHDGLCDDCALREDEGHGDGSRSRYEHRSRVISAVGKFLRGRRGSRRWGRLQ